MGWEQQPDGSAQGANNKRLVFGSQLGILLPPHPLVSVCVSRSEGRSLLGDALSPRCAGQHCLKVTTMIGFHVFCLRRRVQSCCWGLLTGYG